MEMNPDKARVLELRLEELRCRLKEISDIEGLMKLKTVELAHVNERRQEVIAQIKQDFDIDIQDSK